MLNKIIAVIPTEEPSLVAETSFSVKACFSELDESSSVGCDTLRREPDLGGEDVEALSIDELPNRPIQRESSDFEVDVSVAADGAVDDQAPAGLEDHPQDPNNDAEAAIEELHNRLHENELHLAQEFGLAPVPPDQAEVEIPRQMDRANDPLTYWAQNISNSLIKAYALSLGITICGQMGSLESFDESSNKEAVGLLAMALYVFADKLSAALDLNFSSRFFREDRRGALSGIKATSISMYTLAGVALAKQFNWEYRIYSQMPDDVATLAETSPVDLDLLFQTNTTQELFMERYEDYVYAAVGSFRDRRPLKCFYLLFALASIQTILQVVEFMRYLNGDQVNMIRNAEFITVQGASLLAVGLNHLDYGCRDANDLAVLMTLHVFHLLSISSSLELFSLFKQNRKLVLGIMSFLNVCSLVSASYISRNWWQLAQLAANGNATICVEPDAEKVLTSFLNDTVPDQESEVMGAISSELMDYFEGFLGDGHHYYKYSISMAFLMFIFYLDAAQFFYLAYKESRA